MGAVQVADFSVLGLPVQQGSKTAKLIPAPGTKWGVRPVLYDDNDKALKPWRKTVTAAAARVAPATPIDGPVAIHLVFTFERPKTVKREWPAVKPDIDKLMRAVLDGITDSKLWSDDSRVVDARITKQYGAVPGVRVRVGEITSEREVQ